MVPTFQSEDKVIKPLEHNAGSEYPPQSLSGAPEVWGVSKGTHLVGGSAEMSLL